MKIEDVIKLDDESFYKVNEGKVYRILIRHLEETLFSEILIRTNNNQSRAAQILGINRNTLRAKLKQMEKTR